jgi:hypothetical protein
VSRHIRDANARDDDDAGTATARRDGTLEQQRRTETESLVVRDDTDDDGDNADDIDNEGGSAHADVRPLRVQRVSKRYGNAKRCDAT